MKIKVSNVDFLSILIIFIISCVFVLDLFINKGQPASFDEPTHLTNIAMFYKSLKNGELHVTWTDGFANYGMPIGLIAQQTTSYLGALINFVTHNIVLSYNFVVLLGTFISSLLLYWFLRLYFKPESSLLGVFLFHFAPYRIINVYIRGDLPEFFASIFLPAILLGMYYFVKTKNFLGLVTVAVSTALLVLTHPMMVIIYAFIIGPYWIYLLYKDRYFLKKSLMIGGAFILGVGLSGYYIIPLLSEVKYFYYGLEKNHLKLNQYLTLANFLDPHWYYFYKNDIFPRGHFLKSGLLELLILSVGTVYFFLQKKKKEWINLLSISIAISVILTILMTRYAEPIFLKISFLGNIQHQWRLLSAFIFLPAIVLAYLAEKFPRWLILLLFIFIAFLQFPQLYGKNYISYPESQYFFTKENLHGNVMNTIWTGPTQDYPVHDQKVEIITGKGTVITDYIRNSSRKYQVSAETNVHMADYTFYFPGWRAYVDGKETTIQFQDPAYRGVITYDVPQGTHIVAVKFTNTKVRWIGIGASAISFFFLLGGIIITINSNVKTQKSKPQLKI